MMNKIINIIENNVIEIVSIFIIIALSLSLIFQIYNPSKLPNIVEYLFQTINILKENDKENPLKGILYIIQNMFYKL